jgi:threonine-phosphate decarboxylase
MRHGGNIDAFAQQLGCLPEDIIDFSANINPQQAVDWQDLTLSLTPYSDPEYTQLKQALRQRYPLPDSADIELFNGASAAIFALLRYLQPKDVVLYAPLYGEYQRLANTLGCKLHIINRFNIAWGEVRTPTNPTYRINVGAKLCEYQQIPEHSTVIFVNPATPDGTLYDLSDLLTLWQAKNCQIIIDESFLDFCPVDPVNDSVTQHIDQQSQIYLIKSLSKFYGCAGVRVGFIAATPKFIQGLKQFEPAWKLSTFDMAYMQQALANNDFIAQTREQTAQNRALLQQVLESSGKFEKVYPSSANFLLARLPKNVSGDDLQTDLAAARILIRVCDNFLGLNERYVRFAVKDKAAIAQLQQALANCGGFGS